MRVILDLQYLLTRNRFLESFPSLFLKMMNGMWRAFHKKCRSSVSLCLNVMMMPRRLEEENVLSHSA